MELLKVENVSIGYDNKAIVDNINFSVNKGDYLIIVGNNGAGKTTLFKALLGLSNPISGSINYTINKNEIGYLPQQQEYQLDFPASVNEIVLSGLVNKSRRLFYNKLDKEIANKNMLKLNILDLKNKSFKELSGGLKQRVLLARSLCASSEILFLDEPTTGLDPISQKSFYETIKKLNEEGLAIVMISHDINEAIKYAKNVLIIKEEPIYLSKDDYTRGDKNDTI